MQCFCICCMGGQAAAVGRKARGMVACQAAAPVNLLERPPKLLQKKQDGWYIFNRKFHQARQSIKQLWHLAIQHDGSRSV